MRHPFPQKRHQLGFTITELMITIGLSLSVISSVLIGYLATYTSSMDTLAASKLNQDMSALMSLMAGEIRRAGYSFSVPSTPTANLFAQIDNTALEVFNSMALNAQQSGTGSGSCIVFSYDLDEDGAVDASELVGFRLNAGVVQMRTSGNTADPDTCTSPTSPAPVTPYTWSDLTDPDFITITALTFNLAGSKCLNTREPDLVDNDTDGTTDEAQEADCYSSLPTAGSGNITVETREVQITLTGQLATDSFVRLTQTQNVRVRNDLVRVY